jgi:hypothetical protein
VVLASVREVLPQCGMDFRLIVLAACAAGTAAVFVACDLEVDTNYGPHSGLSKNNLPTPPTPDGSIGGDGGLLCGTAVDAGACSVSYSGMIWPKMQGTWHCSDATCHGGTSYQPKLDTAQDAYDNLMAYKISGKPYIDPCSTDPDASAFVCNVQSPFTCGLGQMPFPNATLGSGPMSSGDVSLVQTWVQCGAPNN